MKVVKKIDEFFTINNSNLNNLEEIRIRVNKPILLKFGQTESLIEYIVNSEEILETLQHICDNSIYSFQSQICNGYITLRGGHRVGISGKVIIENVYQTIIAYNCQKCLLIRNTVFSDNAGSTIRDFSGCQHSIRFNKFGIFYF